MTRDKKHNLSRIFADAGKMPASDIASKHGISISYLRHIASKNKVSLAFAIKSQDRRPWKDDETKFLRDHAGLMTSTEIGLRLIRTSNSVKDKADALGISLMKHGERHHLSIHSDHDVELVRLLADEGLPASDIATKMDMSYRYVLSVLNFKTRKQG